MYFSNDRAFAFRYFHRWSALFVHLLGALDEFLSSSLLLFRFFCVVTSATVDNVVSEYMCVFGNFPFTSHLLVFQLHAFLVYRTSSHDIADRE